MRQLLLSAFAISALFSTVAFAQPTTRAATTGAPVASKIPAKAPIAAPATPRSAGSIECSKRADAKGLHGKPRRSFRAECKREMKKKG